MCYEQDTHSLSTPLTGSDLQIAPELEDRPVVPAARANERVVAVEADRQHVRRVAAVGAVRRVVDHAGVVEELDHALVIRGHAPAGGGSCGGAGGFAWGGA
jgi:hypothetical protein